MIHVALSPWDLRDSYNKNTATTLVSILEHCSDSVTVHLLCEEGLEDEDTMKKYQELAGKYNAVIIFHFIKLPEWIKNNKNIQRFTAGALLRLYLPRVLSDDVKKVIYFDSDMIVLTDVAQLWNVDLNGKMLGAVFDVNRECSFYYVTNKVDRNRIDHRRYFNSGLLVMDLEKIRGMNDFTKIIMEMIYSNPNFVYPDQDALNSLFQKDDVFFVDVKYNVPVGLRMTNYRLKRKLHVVNDVYRDCILHFSGTQKPWKIYSGGVDEYYWGYLRKTPWGKDADKLYNDVLKNKKNIVDKIMATPVNKYLRMVESVLKNK